MTVQTDTGLSVASICGKCKLVIKCTDSASNVSIGGNWSIAELVFVFPDVCDWLGAIVAAEAAVFLLFAIVWQQNG